MKSTPSQLLSIEVDLLCFGVVRLAVAQETRVGGRLHSQSRTLNLQEMGFYKRTMVQNTLKSNMKYFKKNSPLTRTSLKKISRWISNMLCTLSGPRI